jgi:hypothetical protein
MHIIDNYNVKVRCEGKMSKDGKQHFLLYATNLHVTHENAIHPAQLYERRFAIE